MIRINKSLAAILYIVVIISTLFILFVFPLLSDERYQISLVKMIITLSVLIFCTEELVKLFFGRGKQKNNKLRIFFREPL